MTKIKMLNDRIIFDGHADSRQECETITLMCDNLAKSKDFKTVRYESGYAEFEKVGKTKELKFAPPTECSCTMIFDDGVISVACAQDATGSQPSFTWNNSGESNTGYFEGECIFPVTLAPGRILDTVVSSEYNDYVVIDENQFQGFFTTGADFTITITTKAAATKQTIDVSTLSGWANLATGNHQITVKTKASGYADSAASNAVTVSKAAVVSAGKLYFSGDAAMGNTPTATVNGVEVENGYQLSFGDVIVINSKNGDYNGMKINGENIINLVNDYPPFNIDWTEGGDIVSTQEGFGPSNQNITINYLSPVGYSVSVSTYEGNGKQSFEYSTDNGTTWNSITGEGQIVASTKQIKFRVTCNSAGLMADASIQSTSLNMNIQFSSPGQSIGTWVYSENYILTQNIGDIVCLPHL